MPRFMIFFWNNYYDTESGINEYELTVFVREKSGKYSRYDEIHRQRAYSAERITTMLRIAGFQCHEGFTLDLDGANLERVYYLAVK